MSGELVPLQSKLAESLSMLPSTVDFAKQVGPAAFVPEAYRGKTAEITAAVMYGHELGLGPMTSLQQISVVKGRPAPSAQLGVALALAAGHEVWVKSATTTKVEVCGRRRGSDEVQTVVWTMDDAKRAGLDRQPTWRAYPRAMLTHRAQAELVRNTFPDVLGGIAAFAEELEDNGDEPTPQTVDATATTKRRRRAPKTAPPAQLEEAPAIEEAPAGDVTAEDKATDQASDIDLNAPPPQLVAPETGAAEEPDGPTPAQMKAMHASLGEAGFTERDDRLAFVSAVVGRDVDSSKNISRAEAGRVIDTAQGVTAGTVGLLIETDGTWTLTESRADTDEGDE